MKERAWEKTKVSPDGTHHVVGMRALYKNRFLRVLPFHAPGLAAVGDCRGGLHIDIGGNPAYLHVFTDTFGFYEDLAAVRNGAKWFHN